jgi:hypothetical protein
MKRIEITLEAYEAIKATLPESTRLVPLDGRAGQGLHLVRSQGARADRQRLGSWGESQRGSLAGRRSGEEDMNIAEQAEQIARKVLKMEGQGCDDLVEDQARALQPSAISRVVDCS